MTSLGVLERTGEEGGGGGVEGVEGVTRRRGGAEGGAGWLKFLFFFSDFERHLTSDEGEAGSELDEEVGDVLDEGGFDGAFLGLLAETQEIETVGILEGLAGEVGLRLWQAEIEVGDGFAFPLEALRFDMDIENVARPAVFDGLVGVGEPPLWGFEPGEKGDVVAPRQLSNSLLDDCGRSGQASAKARM